MIMVPALRPAMSNRASQTAINFDSLASMLFAASEPGVWYDPSDLSTMFQDSAGTTPVTAVEQPVGRILDKSGRGNHASQATVPKRPRYSRRVNLLLATATLATQSITTRAAAYTLAFSGAGSVTLSGTATGTYSAGTHAITCTAGSLTLTVSGAVTAALCVLSIDAHLPYQWVNTDTDYDADPDKFPAYLRFDGVDDALVTGNINFTSTDKMTVWAGVTKLSDAIQPIAETSNVSTSVGAFGLFDSGTGSPSSIGFRSQAAYAGAITNNFAPASYIASAAADRAAPQISVRQGSLQVASSSAAQGTGNYGNYPLHIGARAGTSNYFNGRLYPLIIRGAQSTLSQLVAGELYTRQKMRLP